MFSLEQNVKITKANGINRGFQYKDGLNVDKYELNRNEECAQGGLYFLSI